MSPKALGTGGTWSWQNPLPAGNPLFAINCPTTSACFAGSADGQVLATTNGGANWTVQTTGVSTPINAISCFSATVCVAVGDSGEAISTSNGGATWSAVIINGGNFLTGVSCASTTVCFADGYAGSILTTANGGASWSAQTSGTTANLFSISCPSTTNCVAVGAGVITRTTDGSAWTIVFTSAATLFGVSCADSTNCVAVGQGGAVLTSQSPGCCWFQGDVGSSVTLLGVSCPSSCFIAGADGSVYVRSPLQNGTFPGHGSTPEQGSLFGISCPTTTTCFGAGDYGTIVVTTNGGTGWTAGSGLGSAEFSISCPSTTVCVAVGFGGAIAGTTNGGTSWSGQTSGTTQNLNSISCLSTSACFAVGDGGTVIATTNGGTSWSAQTSNTTQLLRSISCVTATTCFAVTNAANFIKTTNGTTWSSPAAVGAAAGLTGISCPTTTTCFATDADNATTNLIYATTTGGTTWAVSFNLANDLQAGINAAFAAIACPSAANCYAVGASGLIAATSDGGLNWRTDSSPTSASLSAISCPSVSTCYASVYESNGSTVLYTTDSGGNWGAQYGGGTGQFAYTSISCPGTMTCFAIGYGGVVATTTTGGAAWSGQQPTGTTNPVHGMSCTSASDCYAAAGNTLLATHNGGSAWTAQKLTTTDFLQAISCPAANTCFAAGWPGAIYVTSNGGVTWTYQSSFLSGSDQTLLGISCSSITNCVAVGTQGTIISTSNGTAWAAETSGTSQVLAGVSCPDNSSCVAVGRQGLTMTRAAGVWQAHASGTTQNLHGVSCSSTSTCYAVGNAGTVLLTSNGGIGWTTKTSGVAHDLNGVSCAQTTVCLAAGASGAAIVTVDGSSWSPVATPTLNTLHAVAFPNPNQAWLGGLGGTILANPTLVQGCWATLGAAPPSPGPTGATVTLTASLVVTGCVNPLYRFWMQPPGGSWSILRDYSSSNAFSWNANGTPGTYHLEVDVKAAASPASYDSVANSSYTLNGCTAVDLSANPPSPNPPGGTVVITGSSTCPGTPVYRFWVKAPGGAWTVAQPYGTSNVYNWPTTGLASGVYGLEVDVKNQGAAASYEVAKSTTYALQVHPCTTPTLTANPASSGPSGGPIVLTATTSACPNPQFRFWVQSPAGMWSRVQDYTATNTFSWAPSTGGSYHIEVDVRDQAEPTVSYDAVNTIPYQVNACSAVSLGTNPNSPHYPSGSVLLTGTATCPGTATYRFWTKSPTGAWTIARDYSPTNTFSWSIGGLTTGNYGLEVDVRDQNSPASYEAVANTTYVLSATPCTTPTLNASPTSPGPTGGTINFTATTSGCSNPVFRFWVQGTDGSWVIKQAYGPSNTFAWTDTGHAGNYGIEVDVRDQAETASYDAVKNIPYVLKGCIGLGLSANPPNTAAHGSTVVLTATANCPGTPTFRFWVKAPGGAWTEVRAYGTGNTFNWVPATPGTYYLEVDARDQGSTDSYEIVSNITYTVT